jgi:hypothetical protein
MRDPAATVIDPALTSPTMTPPSITSTRFADSMLPCSSPATSTTAAMTWPVRCAPASIVKLPSMRTSPLNRPPCARCPILRSCPRSPVPRRSRIHRPPFAAPWACARHCRIRIDHRALRRCRGRRRNARCRRSGCIGFFPKRHEVSLLEKYKYMPYADTKVTPAAAVPTLSCIGDGRAGGPVRGVLAARPSYYLPRRRGVRYPIGPAERGYTLCRAS